MDTASSIWLIGIISLAAGALIGALAYRRLAPSVRQAEQVKSDLDSTRDELQHYRKRVDEHFDKTAELVNDLTQNYVKVYQHLAAGAQTLGDGKRFDNLLEQQAGKVAIAVDDPARAADPIEAESTPAASAAVAVGAAVEPRDEGVPEDSAAPGAPIDAVDTEAAAVTGDQAETAGAAVDPAGGDEDERAAEAREPVLNVGALDDAIEKADREGDAGAVPQGKPETEVRTTTH